ncbi:MULTISPECIES: replication regulatory protein RepA [Serratia]|uniref:replication regulatory protein RepA n=1 Tax=Serratia TaxID=613 RepID=UPI001F4C2667|nr:MULTISPECIES: replication regulatory protein RepA [Serratia]ULG13790.1 CopB/RepC [Serratia proteamaculans]ULG13932.1 CopB/RepC [Serratia proteamaculans]ULG14175.1 CopB/RepC [Serratia proteamaculans]ULG14579.1 CopB/RepC [Serratia proteamaculans]ULG14913.1 CopB/RepC [Serratia proteamaculans]
MSQAIINIDGSFATGKRRYRKGPPLSGAEKQRVSTARKKMTHKEIKIFVHSSLKEDLLELCNEDALTQAELIERLIECEMERRAKR